MKTQKGHWYAHIQAARVVWIFTQADLPEFNENDIEVIDVTSLEPRPQMGWVVIDGVLEPPPDQSVVELAAVERVWRDGQLTATQWLTGRHRDEIDLGDALTLTADQYVELLTFRKALRDWPQGAQFPYATHRPAPPDWMATQSL